MPPHDINLLRISGAKSIQQLTDRFRQSRGHLLASLTLASGYVAQIGFQMIYFLVLIRMLGPELFGQFAAASAALMIISPLAGIGYGEVALVRISQQPKDAGLWGGNAVLVTALMGLVVTIGMAAGYGLLSSREWLQWHSVLGLGLCELVIVRSCGVIARVHQASGKVHLTALNNGLLALAKAAIAGGLYVAGFRSLGLLIVALNVGLLPLAYVFFHGLVRTAGPVSFSLPLVRREFWLAFSFATGMTSQVIYTDLDKLFLAKWTTAYVVGTYTAGYKILSLSFMPIRALLEATVARQYQLGRDNREQCLDFAYKLLASTVSLSSVIACGLYLLAPYATLFLGSEFEDSIGVLRIGFLLPVIQSVHCVLANYLTAIGHQPYRTLVQMITLVVFVVSGFIVIQRFSWPGAIYCSLASETLLAVLLAGGSVYFTRLDRAKHVLANAEPTMGN